MSVLVYPAIVSPAEADRMQGRFLDFPALTFSASAASELIRVARETLTGELQSLENAGDTWPQATLLQGLDVAPGSTVMLVDVSVDDTPVRLTVSLGERLLKRIDQDAEARSMTRSGYLALGARRLLDEPAGASTGASGGETGQRLQAEIAEFGRRVNDTLGPDSPVGRTLAELDAMALDGLRRLGEEVRSAVRPRPAKPGAPTGLGPATGGLDRPP